MHGDNGGGKIVKFTAAEFVDVDNGFVTGAHAGEVYPIAEGLELRLSGVYADELIRFPRPCLDGE